jgi:glycosyltransferase involved in cell wall biosynthesis
MSSKLAILTCLEGYLDKFVEDQDCGYFYNDVDSLYQVILKILDNKLELDRKKNKAFEQYQQKFSGEIVYNEYMEHILKIIKNR